MEEFWVEIVEARVLSLLKAASMEVELKME